MYTIFSHITQHLKTVHISSKNNYWTPQAVKNDFWNNLIMYLEKQTLFDHFVRIFGQLAKLYSSFNAKHRIQILIGLHHPKRTTDSKLWDAPMYHRVISRSIEW